MVALDGQPLAAPELLERLLLAPAQRADLIVDATAEEGSDAFLVSLERDGAYRIASFPCGRHDEAPTTRRTGATGTQSGCVAARSSRGTVRSASDAGRCHGRHAERSHGRPRNRQSATWWPRERCGPSTGSRTSLRTRCSTLQVERRPGSLSSTKPPGPTRCICTVIISGALTATAASDRCATPCCWTVRNPPRSRSWPDNPRRLAPALPHAGAFRRRDGNLDSRRLRCCGYCRGRFAPRGGTLRPERRKVREEGQRLRIRQCLPVLDRAAVYHVADRKLGDLARAGAGGYRRPESPSPARGGACTRGGCAP